MGELSNSLRNMSRGIDPIAILVGIAAGIVVIVVSRFIDGQHTNDFLGAVIAAAVGSSAATRRRNTAITRIHRSPVGLG